MKDLKQQFNDLMAEGQELIDKMKEEEEKKKEEFPQINDEYWFVDDGGTIIPDNFDRVLYDTNRLIIGNMFKTKKEAEDHLKWLKARAKIVLRIKELHGDWKYDFEYSYYFIEYDYYLEEFIVIQKISPLIPKDMRMKDESIARQIIKELAPEYKIYLSVEEA